MINIDGHRNIDADKTIERDFNGCKVRLFFIMEHNEKIERMVLDHLMLVFNRKKQDLSNVQA